MKINLSLTLTKITKIAILNFKTKNGILMKWLELNYHVKLIDNIPVNVKVT